MQAACIRGKVVTAKAPAGFQVVWRVDQGSKVAPDSLYVTKDMLVAGTLYRYRAFKIFFSVKVGLEETREEEFCIQPHLESHKPDYIDIRIVQEDWVDAGTEMTGASCCFRQSRL